MRRKRLHINDMKLTDQTDRYCKQLVATMNQMSANYIYKRLNARIIDDRNGGHMIVCVSRDYKMRQNKVQIETDVLI